MDGTTTTAAALHRLGDRVAARVARHRNLDTERRCQLGQPPTLGTVADDRQRTGRPVEAGHGSGSGRRRPSAGTRRPTNSTPCRAASRVGAKPSDLDPGRQDAHTLGDPRKPPADLARQEPAVGDDERRGPEGRAREPSVPRGAGREVADVRPVREQDERRAEEPGGRSGDETGRVGDVGLDDVDATTTQPEGGRRSTSGQGEAGILRARSVGGLPGRGWRRRGPRRQALAGRRPAPRRTSRTPGARDSGTGWR